MSLVSIYVFVTSDTGIKIRKARLLVILINKE